ncbi:hypothetical protein Cal6303_3062 [Calothrix sp. PCC 6303]|nr:hypothetical protein Cal6303_3062 [Calothrix sp. PCC 6303]
MSERGKGAGSRGEDRDRAWTPPRISLLKRRGLYPCSTPLLGNYLGGKAPQMFPLHAGGKGLLPLPLAVINVSMSFKTNCIDLLTKFNQVFIDLFQ